jgi:predicted DNA-binding transcriptional regulator
MSKDQAIGAAIVAVCIIAILAYLGLLFLYDPYIKSFINIGTQADVHFWLIAAPVAVAFIGILAIGSWIGFTMATTPPPKPIEEIATEPATGNKPQSNP